MILQGKIALVTGSSRGIGAATAKLLAAHGAKVVVNYARSRERGEAVVAEIREAGGQALLLQADVTQRQEVARMVEVAHETFGPIDILVNNASIRFSRAPFVEHDWADFEDKLLGEVQACFHTTQLITPDMIQKGGGCIVNVSSRLSRRGAYGFMAHTTAKAALDGFSKSLAVELGRHQIRVNVIAPGFTVTDATAQLPAEVKESYARQTPLGRVADPEDVAGAVLLCATEWSRFLTGAYIPISGGAQML